MRATLSRVMTLRDNKRLPDLGTTGPRDCGPAGYVGSRPPVPVRSRSQRPQAGETCSHWLARWAVSFCPTPLDEGQSDRVQFNLIRPLPRTSHPIRADPTESEPIQSNEAQNSEKTRICLGLPSFDLRPLSFQNQGNPSLSKPSQGKPSQASPPAHHRCVSVSPVSSLNRRHSRATFSLWRRLNY